MFKIVSLSEPILIYDWNIDSTTPTPANKDVKLVDDTLRDGLQPPSITNPSIEDKITMLELMARIGIHSAIIGMPSAGKHALDDIVHIAQHVSTQGLPIELNCLARTLVSDVQPIVDIQQRTGQRITAIMFIGSSRIRQKVEGWDMDFILKQSSESIDFAVKEGLNVVFATEDTTRSTPEDLDLLFRNAISYGATGLTIADTVGHITPSGLRKLIEWTQRLIISTGENITLDFHGHNDRGFALQNALTAIECGIDRIHACGLGVGERAGNTSIDQLVVNLNLMGLTNFNLLHLPKYVKTISEVLHFPIPTNYPIFGKDVFTTCTGVHASAVLKAKELANRHLEHQVYSAVPACLVGREQTIGINFMSGISNVRCWLDSHGIQFDQQLCNRILIAAKDSRNALSDEAIYRIIHRT
jgi:2-isopropylmalate synthase